MHDAKGRELKVGDTVVIPAVIKSVQAGEYCTLDVETVGVMPGNGMKNQICALNTKQVYRANHGDEVGGIATEERDGKVYLR
jgi:hypothetical protein